MTRERLYMQRLIRMVRPIKGENYDFLLERLFDKEFYAVLSMDYNRVADVMELREELGNRYDEFGAPRCLEILVVLAKKAEFDLTGTGISFRDMFWEMATNLGLNHFGRRSWNENSIFEIDEILENWMSRRYARNGEGGAFPLRKHRGTDQRKVELWYQLQAYILEKNKF